MDINSLESIQNLIVTQYYKPSLLRLVKYLNLCSLEKRRVRGNLIETFKWVKGMNKGDISKIPKFCKVNITSLNGFKPTNFTFHWEIRKKLVWALGCG